MPDSPNHSAKRNGERGHQGELEEHAGRGGKARPEQALQMQSGAVDEQADRERGAPERIRDLMPDLRQGQMDHIDGEPDRAGPDQRVLHHRHGDRARRLLFRRGVMRQHQRR